MHGKIEKPNVQDIFHLSHMQKGMLFQYLREPEENQYNVQLSFCVEGPVDLSLLEEAFSGVRIRNEVLRSVFRWKEADEPLQIILRECAAEVRVHDLSDTDPEHAKRTAEQLARTDWETRFDLTVLPLRISIIRLEEEKLHLNITHHHILYDGWSSGILIRELFQSYKALQTGKNEPGPKPSYREVLHHHRQTHQPEESLAYWRKYLQGFEPVAFFPTGSEAGTDRSGGRTGRSGLTFSFNGGRLKEYSAHNGVTKAAVVYAACGIFLQKYFSVQDVVVGVTLSDRDAAIRGIDQVIGNFINTIPLRIKGDHNIPVREIVARVNQDIIAGSGYSMTVLHELKKELAIPIDRDIFDTLVVVQNYPGNVQMLDLPEGINVRLNSFSENIHVPLALSVFIEEDVTVEINFDAGPVGGSIAADLQKYFQRILEAILEEPAESSAEEAMVRLGDIEFLSQDEKDRLLESHKGGSAGYDQVNSILEAFEVQALRTPDNVALRHAHGNMTYRELKRLSDQVASYFRLSLGVVKGDLIGLILEREEMLIPIIFGILKAGAAYVPIGTGYPAERVKAIADDAGLRYIITRGKPISEELTDPSVLLDLDAIGPHILSYAAEEVHPRVAPEDLVYVMYTSGSTGKPKGVMIEHRSLVNLILTMDRAYPLKENDRHLLKTTYTFDISVSEIFGWFLSGGSLCLLPEAAEGDAYSILETVAACQVTHINFVPSLFSVFLDALLTRGTGKAGSLKYILLCGEVLPVEAVHQFNSLGLNCLLENIYGPTETTIYCSIFSTRSLSSESSVPIGKPMSNVDLYVLDQCGHLRPDGMPGELCIGGIQVARGYLNNPTLTREKFIPDPFRPGSTIYRTGDLVRWLPDGNLGYLDRIDSQVKIRGYRIELGEIGNRLLQHPSIREAAVVVKETNSDRYLAGYYVSDKELPEWELIAHLSKTLPAYMVPGYYIRMEHLPLMPNGKLNRKMLPEPELLTAVEYVPPSGPTERRLAAIWSEILKLDVSGIGNDRSFFELGGHSLNATTLMNRIYREFHEELSITALFRHPTIKELAELIGRNTSAVPAAPKGRIERSNVEDILELSPIQKGMLFHYLKETHNNTYNTQLSFYLEGRVDASLLKQAFILVQSKNDVLRSVFRWKGIKEPIQLFLKSCPAEFRLADVSDNPVETRAGEAAKIAREEWAARFDLEQLPVRVSLVQMDTERFQLNLTHHHILYDGWSSGILIKELFHTYNDLVNGDDSLLPKPTYREITRRQPVSAEEVAYWSAYLAGYEPVTLFPNTGEEEGAIARSRISFPPGPLEAFARKNNVTRAAVIYTAYAILLQKYFNVDDLLFGITISSRDTAVRGIEHVIGNFVNTMPIRFRRDNSRSLLEAVIRVNQDLVDRTQFGQTSLQEIKEALAIPVQQHVFDTVVGVKNYPVDKDIFQSLKDIRVSLASWSENTDIPLTVSVFMGEEPVVEFSFKQKVVGLQLAAALPAYFSRTFGEILNNPAATEGSFGLLSASGKEEMLGLAMPYPKASPVHSISSWFREQAMKTPDNIALVFEDQVLTYRELDHKSDRIAAQLINRGAGPGEIIGLMANPSLEMITGVLGIAKSGAAFLPLNPDVPQNRLDSMRSSAGCKLVLCQPGMEGNNMLAIRLDEPDDPAAAPIALPEATEDALLYIIYTSGTTGNPKGVMIRHGNMTNYIAWAIDFLGLQSSDRWCLTHLLSFDGAYTAVFGSLLTGASLHILSRNDYVDPSLFLKYAGKNKITHLKVTPSLFAGYADHPDLRMLRSLKILIFGGEQIRIEHIQRTIEVLGSTRLVNHYGPTETTVGAIAGFIDKDKLADLRKKPFVGKPIDNTACYVLGNDGHILPAGAKGELYIGGKGVAVGYIGQPQLTERQFVDDPYSGNGRLYKTGDLASFLPDGNLQIFGRLDDQIKIRGVRTELKEIESCLLTHPRVRNAVVVAKGDGYLVGYFTAAGTLSGDELQAWLLRELPEFMVPRTWVQLSNIPLTSSGKLDKGALPDAVRTAGTPVLPANATEYALLAIFAEILNVRTADIGATQSFFELGGHSLNATALTNRIYKDLKVELPLSEVFKHSTVRELAKKIDENRAMSYSGLTPAAPKPCYELSSAQKRLFILNQLDPASLAYNMPYMAQLEGEVNTDRVRQTFNQLIRRHESLRTSFHIVDGRPMQHIAADAELEWLHLTTEEEPVTVLDRFIRAFDPGRAPLFRAGIAKCNGKTYLMVDMHHIITDGQSHGILISDFVALYSGHPLAAVKFQYRDYTEWQQQPVWQSKVARQKEFWKDMFMDECPEMNLPTDFVRPRVNTHEGNTIQFEWSAGQTRAMLELARGEGSVFMVLLSFFYILMGKLSNLEDITIGTPVAGRQHPDLEGIIGMFVNTIPLRAFPKGDRTFIDFLAEVRAVVLAGMDNQDYPYETLVEDLKISGDRSRNALFSTVFVLDNFEGNELEIPGLKVRRCDIDRVTSKFDLTMTAKEVNGRLSFSIEYSTRLFRRSTVERFAGYFNRIAATVVDQKDIRLSEIDVLTGSERQQIQHDLDNSGVGYPGNMTIVDLFNAQALKVPGRIALTHDNRRLTYAELARRSDLVANRLREAGVRRNAIVGLFLDRSAETIVGMLGILKAGGAYLPLDIEYAQERINYMVNDSGAGWVLTTRETSHEFISGAMILLIEDAAGPDRIPEPGPAPSDLAYIIYTSGTTGQPKGVMVDHRNVVRLLFNDAFQFDFSSDDVWTMFHSPSFDFSVWEIFGALLYGGRLVIVPRIVARDSRAFRELMKREDVTILNQTPRAFYSLIQEDSDSAGRLSRLRMVIFGGEALAPAKLKGWKQKYDGVKLINMYGITETTVHVTYKEIGQYEIDNNICNIGRPIATLSAYVLDGYQRMLPAGVTGELYVGGEGVARGYINKEQLTREKFIDHPFRPGEKLYRSGDYVKLLDSGELQYCGRADNQVKLRGFRIELGEIETALGRHGSIRDVVAVALGKNETTALAAYYVAEDSIDPAALRAFLSKILPEYMIPSYFVHLRELPLTPNGKLNKRALPEPDIGGKEIRPQTAIQKDLLEVWSEVLELHRDKIGIHANFFEIGGNSLLVVRMANRIEKSFQIRTGVADIFAHPTIFLLAKFLDRSAGNGHQDERMDTEDDGDLMRNTLDILREQQA